jgi:hypothetical protein
MRVSVMNISNGVHIAPAYLKLGTVSSSFVVTTLARARQHRE